MKQIRTDTINSAWLHVSIVPSSVITVAALLSITWHNLDKVKHLFWFNKHANYTQTGQAAMYSPTQLIEQIIALLSV